MLGMLVERLGYRPLRDAPRASAAITGMMIGLILGLIGEERDPEPGVRRADGCRRAPRRLDMRGAGRDVQDAASPRHGVP